MNEGERKTYLLRHILPFNLVKYLKKNAFCFMRHASLSVHLISHYYHSAARCVNFQNFKAIPTNFVQLNQIEISLPIIFIIKQSASNKKKREEKYKNKNKNTTYFNGFEVM